MIHCRDPIRRSSGSSAKAATEPGNKTKTRQINRCFFMTTPIVSEDGHILRWRARHANNEDDARNGLTPLLDQVDSEPGNPPLQ